MHIQCHINNCLCPCPSSTKILVTPLTETAELYDDDDGGSDEDDDGDVIRLLPAVERSSTETVHEFSGRVQRIIANSLQVSATPFTSADKMDFIKQLHMHSRQSGHHCTNLIS